MLFKLGLMFVTGTLALFAGKPPACVRIPATVYVATGPTYGLTGDAVTTMTFPGDPNLYTKYVDGEGGVDAYVNAGPCAGTFFLQFNGARALNLVFQNWLNDGTSGPPKQNPSAQLTAGGLFLRGFTFTEAGIGPGSTYTTMLPVHFFGGGLRWEPMESDYLDDNPDFPTYLDMNQPCETSPVAMTVLSPTETVVTPSAVPPCGASYSGPVTTLMGVAKRSRGSLANVGQFGMDFRFRIVVNGWPRY
jgi:hypothetical protein